MFCYATLSFSPALITCSLNRDVRISSLTASISFFQVHTCFVNIPSFNASHNWLYDNGHWTHSSAPCRQGNTGKCMNTGVSSAVMPHSRKHYYLMGTDRYGIHSSSPVFKYHPVYICRVPFCDLPEHGYIFPL